MNSILTPVSVALMERVSGHDLQRHCGQFAESTQALPGRVRDTHSRTLLPAAAFLMLFGLYSQVDAQSFAFGEGYVTSRSTAVSDESLPSTTLAEILYDRGGPDALDGADLDRSDALDPDISTLASLDDVVPYASVCAFSNPPAVAAMLTTDTVPETDAQMVIPIVGPTFASETGDVSAT